MRNSANNVYFGEKREKHDGNWLTYNGLKKLSYRFFSNTGLANENEKNTTA